MKPFKINPLSRALEQSLRYKIDHKTKPLGALGSLEEVSLKIGLVQNTLSPELKNPHIIVFAADHGITVEGVSAYPQEVTYQMVMNFLNGGAAINVFCKQNQIALKVVDAGVNFNFPNSAGLILAKIAKGTRSFLKEKAMSDEQCRQAIEKGAEIVSDVHRQGCNVIGFGDMGIGNSSSASVLMSQICHLPIELCVGRGAGLDDKKLRQKVKILEQAMANHANEPNDPFNLLATYGGFEIAMICGSILQAAELKMLILVDGFIATAAFLVAHEINHHVIDYSIFCHLSNEYGHVKMLEYLKGQPLLTLDMRLGEGTGAAVAYPIIESAVRFLNEMASFESAGVSTQNEIKARA